MRVFSLSSFFSFIILLSACGEQADNNASGVERGTIATTDVSARPALDQLSQSEAIARKARVSEIVYDLDIDLISLADAYQGTVDLQFDLSDKDTK